MAYYVYCLYTFNDYSQFVYFTKLICETSLFWFQSDRITCTWVLLVGIFNTTLCIVCKPGWERRWEWWLLGICLFQASEFVQEYIFEIPRAVCIDRNKVEPVPYSLKTLLQPHLHFWLDFFDYHSFVDFPTH